MKNYVDMMKEFRQLSEAPSDKNIGTQYNAIDDQSKYEYDDSRRPRLTLAHLNRLKNMRKLKKLDLDKRYKFFKDIYGIPPALPSTM
tara:strand:- start:452 stop:712 length:261 start_codon:yes stop_codon:yes gene_type:complete